MRGRSFVLMLFACAVALAFAVGHKTDRGLLPDGRGDNPSATASSNARPVNGKSNPDFATIAPGLVIIDSTLGEQQAEAAGTGIVLTSTGEVLTNNHVIAGATSVQATDVGNGRTYAATVLGYDRSHDVAVLRLRNASGLAVAPLDTGTEPAVGDPVAAVGNAGGTGHLTTSPGTVSALNQSVVATDESSGSSEQLTGLIQVDANVQPGDSGGALVDAAEHVLGITTAAGTSYSFRGGNGSGFAIPIGDALPIRSDIDAGRATETVHVGPTAQLGVLVSASRSGGGAIVDAVVPSAPAANAGIAQGDTITSFGGSAVDSPTTLTSLVDRYRPGQSVALAWTDRVGSEHTTTVTLASGPAG